ncbi:MAG TPA: phage scaffolding protein [Clostridia bacterium]|nr:phage scaffolding protein [Clostridia bacterium]
MPEFLKKLFGDKAMTFEEFETAYKGQESAKDGIKLANLAGGGYVDKEKFDRRDDEAKTAEKNLKTLQDTVKKFEGVDIDKLKTAAEDAQKKFDADLAIARRDNAVDLMLVQAGARNVKAAKALLDLSKATLKEDGSIMGVDIEGLKKSDAYLFTVETQKNVGDGHDGGKPAGDGNKPGTLDGEITAALFGAPPAEN